MINVDAMIRRLFPALPQRQIGSVPAVVAAAAVPEPAGRAFSALGAIAAVVIMRRPVAAKRRPLV